MTPCSQFSRAGLAFLAGLMSLPVSALTWGEYPERVAPQVISTQATEIRLTVSPDGKTALFGRIDDGDQGWQIWECHQQGGTWSSPAEVSFNSPGNDFDPAFSPDGHWVYFFSNRAGGFGGDDLYRVERHSDGSYGQAENLGASINTAGDEWAPTPSPDGKTLMFASNGRGGAGGQDLWWASVAGHGWGKVEALPGLVNTGDDEFDATWLADGKTLVFTRRSSGQDGSSLWLARFKNGAYLAPEKLPEVVNGRRGWVLGPTVLTSEPDWLYFSSSRYQGAEERLDILRIRYQGL